MRELDVRAMPVDEIFRRILKPGNEGKFMMEFRFGEEEGRGSGASPPLERGGAGARSAGAKSVGARSPGAKSTSGYHTKRGVTAAAMAALREAVRVPSQTEGGSAPVGSDGAGGKPVGEEPRAKRMKTCGSGVAAAAAAVASAVDKSCLSGGVLDGDVITIPESFSMVNRMKQEVMKTDILNMLLSNDDVVVEIIKAFVFAEKEKCSLICKVRGCGSSLEVHNRLMHSKFFMRLEKLFCSGLSCRGDGESEELLSSLVGALTVIVRLHPTMQDLKAKVETLRDMQQQNMGDAAVLRAKLSENEVKMAVVFSRITKASESFVEAVRFFERRCNA